MAGIGTGRRNDPHASTPADLPLPGYLALCLLLGGSSYGGWVPNALVQLAGVVALAWIGMDDARRQSARMGRALGTMLFFYLGWSALTLLPLPAATWPRGAVRHALARDYGLLGMAVPARPLSLDPDRTIAAMLSAIPFVAALVLGLAASGRARIAAAGMVVGLALVSIPLGALQMLGGAGSPWYFYTPTNVGAAVGFFANANHLATSLLMTLPFVAAFAARDTGGCRRWLLAGMAASLLFGIVLDGSIAGLLLAGPAVFGSVLVYRRGIGRPARAWMVVGAGAMLAAVAPVLLLGPMHRALAAGTDSAARATSMRLTMRAVRDFLPLGSGLGSFRWLYPRYEDPRGVTIEFNVHAHDDYLEVALELGLVGIALTAAALVWVGARSAAAWSGRTSTGSLARAASVALAMLLFHSLVDFPARTAALAALAGFAAALLEAPVARRGRATPAPLS